MIESQSPFQVKTLAECASYCKITPSVTCDTYVKHEDKCYVGQITGTSSYLADPGTTDKVYFDSGMQPSSSKLNLNYSVLRFQIKSKFPIVSTIFSM